MPRNASREYRIYLAIWRKAYQNRESGQPLRIKASNLQLAISMRQGMYRAMRPYREGELTDPELKAASEYLVVYLEKGPDPQAPHYLELRDRRTLDALNSALEELGLTEKDLMLPEERNLEKAVEDIVPESGLPPRATPFYQRD